MSEFLLEMANDVHVQLAFAIVMLALAIAWTFNWKHFARYWIMTRPYDRRSIFLLRTFFFASLVGAGWGLIETIFRYDLSLRSLAISLLDAAVLLIPLAALDCLMRWRWGAPKQADWNSKASRH